MRCLTFALLISLPFASLQADTTIYRCTDADGTLIFSDRPCDDTAQVYESRESLSVISAPDNVAERVEANREFIDSRRERLTEGRRGPEAPSETTARPPQRSPQSQQPMILPAWPAGETERPSPPVPPTERPEQERNERFSALGGRQPGSRRRDQSP